MQCDIATASLESQMLPPRIYCGCNLISYNETFHPWFSSRSFLSWQKFQIGTTGTLSNLTHLLFHVLRDGFRRKNCCSFGYFGYLEQQQQAASLVVVGAQQDQGGGVLSPCLLQQHKATNHEAALFCTRRSGRSLKTRQGGAKGWRRRRSCKSESLVYLTVTFVVFFFYVFRDGVSAWKGVCGHESARQIGNIKFRFKRSLWLQLRREIIQYVQT